MPTTESTRAGSSTLAPSLPVFVASCADAHYLERVEKSWGGSHLLHCLVLGNDAIHLSGNDYLCLAGQSELVDAQARTLARDINDHSVISRHSDTLQGRLEEKFAQFLGAEDSLLCQSGWSANVSLIQSLARPGTPVYLDTLAHTSLWEGACAAEARTIPFLHNDAADLERQSLKHGPGVIAVDSIYTTNGSLCPLQEMVDVAERTGSIIAVDESHSLGTHGPHGAGLVMELGLRNRVHFVTASLAKAFAGRAGIITCTSRFKEDFAREAKPIVCSTGCLLSHDLAWFDAALDFMKKIDDRRLQLRAIACTVRKHLSDLGYNVSDSTEQIIALEAGPEQQTMVLRNALQENGIFGTAFCAPTTAKNRSLMRLTLNSGLTEIEITKLVDVCARIRDCVNMRN